MKELIKVPQHDKTPLQRLAEALQQYPDNPSWPDDGAAQLDHYLYGTTKRLMQERGITRALAYDEHFEQAGFEALLRQDPPH